MSAGWDLRYCIRNVACWFTSELPKLVNVPSTTEQICPLFKDLSEYWMQEKLSKMKILIATGVLTEKCNLFKQGTRITRQVEIAVRNIRVSRLVSLSKLPLIKVNNILVSRKMCFSVVLDKSLSPNYIRYVKCFLFLTETQILNNMDP